MSTAQLLERTTCPHCWATFPPEEVLWIACHDDLRGDPRLGPDQLQRFLPTRFTLEGDAVDARGFVCQSLACPKCHLGVPRALLETEPAFVSILGAPACGKSFFLAAMTWQLRRLLPEQFALDCTDADPIANLKLTEYEESLFLNPRAGEYVYLSDLIRKTELQGDLYDTVNYGNQTVSYPRPFLFTLQPRDNHPKKTYPRVTRTLCMYDNAGEHFQVGRDSTSSPVTRHLSQAFLLLFLFDPLQDPRFHALCRTRGLNLPALATGRSSRQESILGEAAARVRRSLGLPQGERHNRPMIVVVTKLDAWAPLLDEDVQTEPYRSSSGLGGVDRDRVEARSRRVRELLAEACPELVSAAEGFAREVVYVPVSALGQAPRSDAKGAAIRPGEIRPAGVTVPLLYGICRWLKRLVPGVKRNRDGKDAQQADAKEGPLSWLRQG